MVVVNNLMSLICYFFVTVFIYIIEGSIVVYNSQVVLRYVIGSIFSIIILVAFTLIGRFALRNTNSLWKNACSVLLPLFIGLVFVNNVASTPHGINYLWLYYGYSASFIDIIPSLIPYENTIAFGMTFVLMPSILFLLGLQWQSKKKNA